MHSVSGKLNKTAQQFQAGESTGFGIRVGVKYVDPKTKQTEWTNYSAVIFAKSPNQIQFYKSVLIEGAVVSIGAEKLKVDSFDGQNGQILSISMLNARLTFAHSDQQAAPQPQQQTGNGYAPSQNQNANAQQTAGYPSNGQQAPAQQPNNFDDDIGF